MGNQLQKQYNIKTKPLKLPGAYNFLRFAYHPNEQSIILIIKHPHKATMMKSNMILPIKQIKHLSQSNDSVALCQKCLPLALVQPKGQIQMKILMHKILRLGSQIGRCFLSDGRIMVWCQQKRGFSSMSPEQLQHGKVSQKSQVFTSGITLINFLYCIYENQKFLKKEQQKKEKEKKDIKKNKSSTISSKKQVQTQYNNKPVLPTEIKLFFDPKDRKQYYQILNNLSEKLNATSFWHSISEGLRQLILIMLSEDPLKRIDLQTVINIPYFQQCYQLRLYFILADEIQILDPKQARVFMKSLQIIIKEAAMIQNQILEEYFIPVLISIAQYKKSNSKQSTMLAALAVSILIQVNNPPKNIIYEAFKKAPSTDRNIILVALQKREKLYFLLEEQRYESAISRMTFCCYQCEQLLPKIIKVTPSIMATLKGVNYKKEIQLLLVTKVLSRPYNKNEQNLLLDGLKCSIQLIKNQSITSINKFQNLKFNPLNFPLQINIHILCLYRLMIQQISPKNLMGIMMPKLQEFLSQTEISDEIFTTAHGLVNRIMTRLYQFRKLDINDDIKLQYGDSYFQMKSQQVEIDPGQYKKKLKKQIQKYQIKQLQWLVHIL